MKSNLPSFVIDIIQKFQKANLEIYIVGGAVRDLLTKREVKDWDLTTNATPEKILELFPHAFYDNKFGTVGIPLTQEPKNPIAKQPIIEVTTFRSEEAYSDRRHPDKVIWGKTLAEDLTRRDFTINSIALSPITHNSEPITIIDPFHGQKDLKNKIIRAVGNPQERFSEDSLRMMRAVRIAAELGFTIEEKTFQAIKNNVPLIHKISAERIRDELFKLLASSFPYEGVVMLRTTGLMAEILPEVEKGFGVPQKSPGRHHVVDVGTHLLYSLRYCPSKDSLVRLAALLHDVGKPQTFRKDSKTELITFYNHEVVGGHIVKTIADRLKLSNKDKDKLFLLVRWHLFTVDERQTDSAIKRFIRNVGPENLLDILAVRTGDRLGGGATETSWRLDLFKKRLIEVQKQPFSIKDLKINGNDVMRELKIPSGPQVGKILNQLFAEVDSGALKNTKEELMKSVKELI
ncbi:HD domain-containing protein [Candidatus Microgenomates bacterium]|nr:HD domain-containing protein [Candidatus Microgenomates bacterium]